MNGEKLAILDPVTIGYRLDTALPVILLPMGRDPRLLRVIEALLQAPGDSRDLVQWGRLTGASGRTMARPAFFGSSPDALSYQRD